MSYMHFASQQKKEREREQEKRLQIMQSMQNSSNLN